MQDVVNPLLIVSAFAAWAAGVATQRWLGQRTETRWADELRLNQIDRARARGVRLDPPRTKADVVRDLESLSLPKATGVHDCRGAARVPDALPRVLADLRPESRADAWTDAGHIPAETPENTGPGTRVHGGVRDQAGGQVLLMMSAGDQAAAFLEFWRASKLGKCAITGKREDCRTSDAWMAAYRDWARANAIGLVSQTAFLRALARADGVERDRRRLKDEAGRALRNAAGTPDRPTFYTVSALEAAQKPRKAAPEAKIKSRDEILGGLERGPPDETWAEGLRASRRAA